MLPAPEDIYLLGSPRRDEEFMAPNSPFIEFYGLAEKGRVD
jgi:hypothetical protein